MIVKTNSKTWLAVLVLMIVGLFSACKGDETKLSGKKGSSGKTLELMIVADKDTYSGSTFQIIDSLFAAPKEGLLNTEPLFSIVVIPPSSFQNTEMFRVHRNIIILDIKKDNPNKVYKHIDSWAEPQVVFDFAVTNRHTLDSFLLKYHDMIIDNMYDAEHRRVQRAFMSIPGYDAMKAIEKNFGFHLTLSNEYIIAKMQPDFAWIRKETKDYSIGLLIRYVPYTTQDAFAVLSIQDSIDAMMKQFVPGSIDSSYMGLERKNFPIVSRPVTLAGQYCIEERGLWRTFGDYMGGPFVSYTLTSPDKQNLITLVGFVFSPRYDKPSLSKRDFLMQIEGVCYSLKFLE